jgi:uncharacterized membrane protein
MNRIVTESCKTIRQQAQFALQGKWKGAMFVFFLYMLFSLAVISPETFIEYDEYGRILNLSPQLTIAMIITGIYSLLVTGAFTYGISKYGLKISRGENASTYDIFDGFTMIFKTLGLALYITIKVLLWSLLFIIPGIVAAFRYALSFYVMVDNPSYSISQCVEESKARMQGNKGKMVLLNLSFIGWIFVTTFAAMALMTIMLPPLTFLPVAAVTVINSFVVSIIMLPLMVYILVANTRFYELTTPVSVNF